MPKLGDVALAWSEIGHDELGRLFPNNLAPGIGWGEPFCFKCGWLSPTKEGAEYPRAWTQERVVAACWNLATGWLERGHLHDHQFGGSTEPLNLVPLCPLCHESQPECETREAGIAFVNEKPAYAHITWLAQVYTDEHFKGQVRPGKSHALNSLLRAHAAIAVGMADFAGAAK